MKRKVDELEKEIKEIKGKGREERRMKKDRRKDERSRKVGGNEGKRGKKKEYLVIRGIKGGKREVGNEVEEIIMGIEVNRGN